MWKLAKSESEKEYDKLMGVGSLYKADANAAISLASNGLAYESFLEAAILARKSELGKEKIIAAAQKAYDAVMAASKIALNLGFCAFSAEYSGNALLVATEYKLGKDKKDGAISMANAAIGKSRSNKNLHLRK